MEKKRPLLTIRPKFDPGLTVVQALGVTLGGFIVTTFMLGTLFFLLFSAIGLGRHLSGGSLYGFFMVLSLLGIPPSFYELKKRAYQRTIYNFYEDYIEFQYFHYYITRRRGRARYTDIADLAQDSSALQEHQSLQTVYIFIPGMAGMRQRQRATFSGLKLADLPSEKDYMTVLRELIEARLAALAAGPVYNTAPAAPQGVPVVNNPLPRGNPEPPPPLPVFADSAPVNNPPPVPSSAPAAAAPPAVKPATASSPAKPAAPSSSPASPPPVTEGEVKA